MPSAKSVKQPPSKAQIENALAVISDAVMASPVEQVRRNALDALFDLMFFRPEMTPAAFNKKNDMYSKGDEDSPWMSEAYLYVLLGKEDARSILVRLRRLAEALGYSATDFDRELWREHKRRYRATLEFRFAKAESCTWFVKYIREEQPDLRKKLTFHVRRVGDDWKRHPNRFCLRNVTMDEIETLKAIGSRGDEGAPYEITCIQFVKPEKSDDRD